MMDADRFCAAFQLIAAVVHVTAGPSCVSSAPQLKREWSRWPEFGWIPANLCDFSKA